MAAGLSPEPWANILGHDLGGAVLDDVEEPAVAVSASPDTYVV